MSLCINSHCPNPQNRDDELFCLSCGSELLLQGRYRVMRQLGGGGFGLTFEMIEVRAKTPKVLKVLINHQSKAVELFQQESEVLSKLTHPGIPKVERDGYFTYFPRNSQSPIHCLVMEKIVGMDLQKWMENRGQRPIDQTLAVQWLNELVTILQQVHSQNFFHRDIKPPNIMLRATGELALIDFGTARQVTQTYWMAQAQGQVTGIVSSGYTPVEQMNGQAVPQSDFFALGRTFVYLLTGKQPTDSTIYNVYGDQINWQDYAPNISPQLSNLIDQMMARVPNQRPANTQVILQQLAEIERGLQQQAPLPPLLPPPPQEQQVPAPPPPKDLTRRRFTKIFGFGGLGLAGSVLIYTLIPKFKSNLVVSSGGSGDYKTISEAIKNAQPGTTILVRPGLYQESLIVNKFLKIIGDGPKAQIIIENADSNCLVLDTDNAEITGLTLRGLAGQNNKKFFTVDILQGKPVLTDCDITSDSLAGVAVHGTTANPTIQKCQVHDGKSGGIYIYDNAQATLAECEVFRNTLINVEIKGSSNVVVQKCNIYDGKDGGLVFHVNAQGTAEDCDIFGNALVNVEIRENSKPVIQRCKIHDGKQAGIAIVENSQGVVKDCDIYANFYSGVEIREGSNPLVQRCQIHDGKQGGLLIQKKARGTVENCNIFNNALSGVEIREDSDPVIRQCNINKNKYNAVYIHTQAKGTVENSDLTGNDRSAFFIDSTSKVQSIGNKIDPTPSPTPGSS
ncbi:MAG: right-handed parallel beta-helix repeat-containing protein [Goleter apudmare HA4340-LM2]|jgi:parallel beta-helix repeat protein|nr:right-handed parallel beta-helix repeat-containing protein [Goleter apudmare HA4340-LM2]